jgi:Cu-Zn family superoxide dismutase
VGDLGNITADKSGRVRKKMYDSLVKLTGEHNIIGRSVVIHAKRDDLGLGGDKESLITGNAGKRIGCGVIGLSGKC